MTIELYQGDCLKVLKTLKDGSIDLVLADPPYGTTDAPWDSLIPLEPLWIELRRVAKPEAAIVMTADQPFTTTLIASNIKEFRYCWTWVKQGATGFMNANKMPLKNTEDVAVFYRKLPTFNPQGVIATGKFRKRAASREGVYGARINKTLKPGQSYPEFTNYPRQTIRIGRDDKIDHQTQKPQMLMQYLIRTYTNAGDVVLDFCMGSGTTGVAAYNLDRSFIGIEKTAQWFAHARKRIDGAKTMFDK